MASVLVIGGTGTLGRSVVGELLARRHHQVRVLSRRRDAVVPDGVDLARGDAVSGEGLPAAMEGTDTVVLSVVNARRMVSTEVGAMRTVLASVGDRHLVNISIVGVDRHRYSYYRAKLRAEELLEGSNARWSNQRATQFHDLIDRFLGFPVFFKTPHLAFQPIDTAQVATRLVDLVEAGPGGRAADIGGPEVLPITELSRLRRTYAGRSAVLIPAPRVGFLADFDKGEHLSPDHRVAGTTWEEWLRRRAGAGGPGGAAGP